MLELRTFFGMAAVAAVTAFPATATAEQIVPPSNSAAAQYTEAFPTAGGEQEVGGHKKGKRPPSKVLGGRDTHRLESKGKQGKEVAHFAAETSPAPVATHEQSGSGSASPAAAEPETNSTEHKAHGSGGGNAGGNGGGGGGGAATPAQSGNPPAAASGSGSAAEPNGSSGLGEVLSQATGSSSSGQLGLLLPLVLIGAVIWSLVFLWRQRRRIA